MRQSDVMRDISWKIKNYEATRSAVRLRPEHFGVALGQRSIHGQIGSASSLLTSATHSLVSISTSGDIDPDESLWPRG